MWGVGIKKGIKQPGSECLHRNFLFTDVLIVENYLQPSSGYSLILRFILP